MLFLKILFIILTYLIASIPFALVIGKIFKNMDIREYGSGNIGSTNAARVLGYRLGILTLLFDVLKGFIPVIIAKILFGENYACIVALVAVIGHAFPIYLKFRGGKAVATSLGVLIALSPKTVFILIFIFFTIFMLTKYVSLASIVVAGLAPLVSYMTNSSDIIILLCWILGWLIIIRHKSNILNLLLGKEQKFFDKANKR